MSLMPSLSIWSVQDPTHEGRIENLEGKYVRTTRFAVISSGTSGTVTLPPHATVVLNDFGGTTDAIISGISGGFPTYTQVFTAGGAVVGTTFDSSANYVLSGTPSSYSVTIIYRVQQPLEFFDSTSGDIIDGISIINPALSATSPIFYSPSTGVISSQSANASQDGYLTSTDWSTFNSKESALTFTTGLTRVTNTITNNLSTGISGGQTLTFGTGSGDNGTITSTSNGTKGKILFGTSAYDEVNNRLGIGFATPVAPIHVSLNGGTVASSLFASGLDGILVSANAQAGWRMISASNGSSTALTQSNCAFSAVGSNRGTVASPVAVASSDVLGFHNFLGYDGASRQNAVRLITTVDGSVSSGVIPGRFGIFTTNSSGTLTEAVRFDSSQVTTFSGKATWATGLGAINHILGPNDQALSIVSAAPLAPGVPVAGRAINITASNATAGPSNGFAAGGAINIQAGDGATTSVGFGDGGSILIRGGKGTGSSSAVGGTSTLAGGLATGSSNSGPVVISTSSNISGGALGGTVSGISITSGAGLLSANIGGVNGGPITTTLGSGGTITAGATHNAPRGGDQTTIYGDGGAASGTTTSNGGRASNSTYTGATGGAATGAGTNIGGTGTSYSYSTGGGGNASGGISNTGGNAGTFLIALGIAGTGSTANGTAGKFSITQTLSGSDATESFLLSPTWNTTGTPTAVKVNVTDTASTSTSLFLDLQKSGVSQFSISKSGTILTTSTSMSVGNGFILTPGGSASSMSFNIGGNRSLSIGGGTGQSNTKTSHHIVVSNTIAAPSGTVGQLSLAPTYNEVASTASNVDLLINRTETSIGSGAQLHLDMQTAGVSNISFDTAGNIKINKVGGGLYVKQGANATMGTGTLVGGTVVIPTTKVTVNSRIFVTDTGGGVLANIGSLYAPALGIIAGTSFTVTSTNALDNSTFNWLIVEPA